MEYDLSKVGVEKGLQYECITTTISKDGIKNAGAFAFVYLGEDKVHCHLFEGSKTLKNILDTNEYVVNITQYSLVFTTLIYVVSQSLCVGLVYGYSRKILAKELN